MYSSLWVYKVQKKKKGTRCSAQLYHPGLQVLSNFSSPLLNHVPPLCPCLDSSSPQWACTIRGHDTRPDIVIITHTIMVPTLGQCTFISLPSPELSSVHTHFARHISLEALISDIDNICLINQFLCYGNIIFNHYDKDNIILVGKFTHLRVRTFFAV
jgi:hypothetical protein